MQYTCTLMIKPKNRTLNQCHVLRQIFLTIKKYYMYHCTFFNNGIIFFAKIYLDVLFWVGRIVHHAHRRDGLKTEEGKSDAQCAFRRVLCPRALRRKQIFNQCSGSANPRPGIRIRIRPKIEQIPIFFSKRYKTHNDVFLLL